MKYLNLVSFLLFPSACLGWTLQTSQQQLLAITSAMQQQAVVVNYMETRRFMSGEDEEDMHMPASSQLETEDPCWQTIYGDGDDDCGMSSVYAANFVASKWIKSMPCGEGIKDCDMHTDLNRPGSHSMDDVDVMGFLGLKKAVPVTTKSSGEEVGSDIKQ